MHDQYAILAADLAAALEESGSLEQLDGIETRIVAEPSELVGSEYESAMVERKTLWYLSGSLPEKVVDQRITYQGKYWQALTVDRVGAAIRLRLERGMA